QATAVNRSWQYDRSHNVRVIDDSRWGQTRYRYNTNDQILHTLFEGARPHEEQFSYDANGNLSQHLPTDARGAVAQINQRQQAGRVVQQGDNRYRYDDNGRLVEKTEHRDGFRPQIWRYRWDTQNQLTHCETPDGSRWHYRYDAFGRRIRKLKIHDGKLTAANLQRWLASKPDVEPRADAIMGQDYLWSANQLIEETPIYADGTPAENQRVRWLYEPGTLTPSARFEKGRLHYIVSDHQGTVREMLDEQGVLVWAQRLKTWGQAEHFQAVGSHHPDYQLRCNFRFLGQFFDEESNLYYNRHRYYSPETAQYISADPIGLRGGFNPYSYVHNPLKWVDPYGLTGGVGNKGEPSKPDFYVGPDGPSATLPSTGYRHMKYQEADGSINKFVDPTIESKSAPVTYFGFDKYPTGSAARDGFQIAPEWSDARLRGTFDTLQLYEKGVPQVRVPYWKGDEIKTKLEPFATAYPEHGAGGARQLHADWRTIHFDSIKILPDK
ncbi:RHS repeat domain-containing protein, partial [Xenorhabdus sp. KJ12.1]|uniref:RHS repeat domain-containing protein n=1 Tax=Xenorhabdus sp. KJ12.1 TaxID=1851571 RepID=UPI00187C5202